MLGGYQILDLRNIDLSRSTSEASITDVEVLKQLSHIADHIQKNYDFNKPLQNQLKPLLIRYRDKKVGEKHEVALYGNIEVINTYYKFRIIANNEGEQLTINVEFEEKTDEYSNKYWDIKTAKVLLTSAKPIFEEITDKDGNKRFVEGDISILTKEGVSKTYGKWSLSGSHLLFVLAIKLENGISYTAFEEIAQIELPEDIFDKIYPVFSSVIEIKELRTFGSGADAVVNMGLSKTSGKVNIFFATNYTSAREEYIRIPFDLLIDNE